jgi:isopenicillin N synthase-like dioxygenase
LTRNLWIPGDEEFRTTLLTFFAACTEAADRIFRAFALALDLPELFLVDRHRQQEHTLRLLHYPPLQQQPKPGQARAGEHSDYGSITLLFQDDIGGLEVKTTDGDWIGAPQIPGTVLVNTGNLMQRWSNDVFCSTCHRVGLPTGDRAFKSRYAIAFFCQPDHDAEIVCIDRCQGANNPAKYPPILAGDYLISLLQATY